MEHGGGGGRGRRRRFRRLDGQRGPGVWLPVRDPGSPLVDGVDFAEDTQEGGGDEYVFVPDSDDDDAGDYELSGDEMVLDSEVQPDPVEAACGGAAGAVQATGGRADSGGVEAAGGGADSCGVEAAGGAEELIVDAAAKDEVLVKDAGCDGIAAAGGDDLACAAEDDTSVDEVVVDYVGGGVDIAGHSQPLDEVANLEEAGGMEELVADAAAGGNDDEVIMHAVGGGEDIAGHSQPGDEDYEDVDDSTGATIWGSSLSCCASTMEAWEYYSRNNSGFLWISRTDAIIMLWLYNASIRILEVFKSRVENRTGTKGSTELLD